MSNVLNYEHLSITEQEQEQGWLVQWTLDNSHPVIQDHRVQDQLIVSGACWIEVILSLVRKVSEQIYQIEDWLWISSLIVDQQGYSLSLLIQIVQLGKLEIKLLHEYKELVRATLKPVDQQDGMKQRVIPVQGLWSQCSMVLEHDAFYKKLSSLGFAYGPSYRLIQRLGCTMTWSFAELIPLESRAFYDWDPGVIDVGLQTCLGIAYANQTEDSAHLPFSFKYTKTYCPLSATRYIYAIKNTKIKTIAAYHLFFLDAEGKVLMLMQDFVGRRLLG